MDIFQVYQYGLLTAVVLALVWSLILDQKKPPTAGEFALKLLARCVFLAFLFAVLIGFLHLAIGLFRTT